MGKRIQEIDNDLFSYDIHFSLVMSIKSTVRAGEYYRSLFRPLSEIKERTASATALALEKEMSLQTSSAPEPKSVSESQIPL